MPLITNFRYRPEIDGLRAVAVVAVVLFHAGLGVPGGFIGVDVFFVISGFLITSLILKDLQEGEFTLANFWERRARRIIPAVVVVVVVTLVAGWFLLLPSDYAKLGKSTAWQAVFGANFYFWRNTNYFAGPSDEQPLLHTWSLAVEEQFYLLFPLLLLGLFLIPAFRRRRLLLGVFGAGFIVSLAVAIYAVPRMPAVAFYLLPTRAWELLCGSIVAILPTSLLPRSRIIREAIIWIALMAIILPCFFYTKNTPFPGLAAIPPCLGTSFFIWASASCHHGAPGGYALPFAARLLAVRPVVFIGLISYSLYLWHWPIFAFSNYRAAVMGPLSTIYCLSAVGLAVGLSILSWRFVEMPFRKRRLCAYRIPMFRAAAAGIVAVFAVGVAVSAFHGIPSRIPRQARLYANAAKDEAFRYEGSAKDAIEGCLPLIGKRDSKAPVSLLVWGDSHAMAAMPAFDAFLKSHDLTGCQATHSGTAPIIGASLKDRNGHSPEKANKWNKAIWQYIVEKKIPVVVLVGKWDVYAHKFGKQRLKSLILDTIERLEELGGRVYLVMDVPTQPVDVPRILTLGEIVGTVPYRMQQEKAAWDQAWGDCPASPEEIRKLGARIIDPCPAMIDCTGDYYAFILDGVPIYRDKDHLSVHGAMKILLPILQTEISRAELKASRAGSAGN